MSHAENTIIEPKNRIPKTIIFFIFLRFESNGKNTEFIERVENFFCENEKRRVQSKNTIFAAARSLGIPAAENIAKNGDVPIHE